MSPYPLYALSNLGSLLALGQVLGRRVVVTYLLSVVLSAIFLGALVNAVAGANGLAGELRVAALEEHGRGLVSLVCALLMVLLCLMTVWRRGWLQRLFVDERGASQQPD